MTNESFSQKKLSAMRGFPCCLKSLFSIRLLNGVRVLHEVDLCQFIVLRVGENKKNLDSSCWVSCTTEMRQKEPAEV